MLWCAALWYGADAVVPAANPVDRLRNAIVLGIAIPGVLGIAGILYPATLWIAAVALVVLRLWRRVPPIAHDFGLYATLALLAIVLWPPLARPLTEGDSLLYHFPNAIAWMQDHSLWTSRAPYWYYPGGSELLAAGFIGAAGRFTVPIAGAAALMLITARLYDRARAAEAGPLAAASLALAFAFMPLAAFQGGSLENDLLLAAFFVESLVAADAGAFASLALTKPFGFIASAIAAVAVRPRWQTLAIAAVPFAVWNVRTIVLWHAGGSADLRLPYWSTAIASDPLHALPELGRALVHDSPGGILWLAFILLGFLRSETRRIAWAGLAMAVLYAFLPFAYRVGTTDYLAGGSSLRYLLPAFSCGALVATGWLRRFGAVATIGFAMMALAGAAYVTAIYWNDADTHIAPLIAALLLIAVFVASRVRATVVALAFALVAIAGAQTAAGRYLGFYDDGMDTHAFTWLAESNPTRIVSSNVRIGMIEMSAPAAIVIDAGDGDGCAVARERGALWFVGSDEDPSRDVRAALFARARSCGTPRYVDSAAIVVDPGIHRE